MANIDFTTEQKQAIYSRGSDILVAAAAGSGKTAVLVERVTQMILDQKKPVDIDKLLIVTFTNAAAGEMRQRISNSILKNLEKNPDNEHLQKQNALLSKSSITTIHSFCLKVIRQNFHMLDIDPSFRVADETEINLIKNDVLEELFEEEYSKEDNDIFFSLVESYGGKIKDDGLQNLLLYIYEFMESSPYPERWIKEYTKIFDINPETPLDELIWFNLIKEDMKIILNGILNNINIAITLCNKENGPIKYIENLLDDRIIVEDLILSLSKDINKTYNLLTSIKFSRLATYKKSETVSIELKDKVKKIRDTEIKKEVTTKIKNYFIKSPEKMKDDLIKLYPMMKSLSKLVFSFSELYSSKKKEKNIVDFHDIQHFCLEILLDKETNTPTKIAIEMRQKFNEILIDEYQDSNQIQELILGTISNTNPNNRFMVGDMKQSIYRFRHAKPELFMDKYNKFSSSTNTENLKIDLSQNFRSRKCVLDAVNFLFYQFMNEKVGEINYNETQELHVGAKFEEPPANLNISTNCEILLIEEDFLVNAENFNELEMEIDDLDKIELESKFIAKKINDLVKSETPLFIVDKEKGFRPVEYKDIVILVRSIVSTGETIMEELKTYNIPSFVNTSKGYYNSLEVLTILAFLRVVDNPRQDIHLLTVLHSPVYSIKNQELLNIRRSNMKKAFYDCIISYVDNEENYLDESKIETIKTLKSFLVDLNRWRDMSVYMPINELIWTIYNETDYINYVGVMPGGIIRQGNLKSLQEKAINYESTSYRSLFHFIKYIEKLQKSNVDAGSAKVLSENENLVRIMTVHQSKGLEFPVVFVSFLGRGFNFVDKKQNIILHPDLGFGPIHVDLENRIKTNTIARLALTKKMHQEILSEELRILYVALTRAKEKLILTGLTKNFDKSYENWNMFIELKNIKLPTYYLLKSSSFLDFLIPAISRHRDAKILNKFDYFYGNKELYNHDSNFHLQLLSKKDLIEDKEIDNTQNEILLNKLEDLDINIDYSGKKELINQKLTFLYPYLEEKNLPTKVSISEIKRTYQEQDQENSEQLAFSKPLFEIPDFLQSETKVTAAYKGTIIHTVVRHLDLEKHTTTEKIQIHISNLVSQNIIKDTDVQYVPIKKILSYANSDLAKRIRNSTFVKKEAPFVMGLSPEEVYNDKNLKNFKEKILVHGIIDCYFKENDTFILIDYKSDYVTKDNLDSIREKYKTQLSIYKKAIERSADIKVSETLIYLFGIDDFIHL